MKIKRSPSPVYASDRKPLVPTLCSRTDAPDVSKSKSAVNHSAIISELFLKSGVLMFSVAFVIGGFALSQSGYARVAYQRAVEGFRTVPEAALAAAASAAPKLPLYAKEGAVAVSYGVAELFRDGTSALVGLAEDSRDTLAQFLDDPADFLASVGESSVVQEEVVY